MTALVPGTFDPLTLGHTDIIERAARIFEQVVVAVLVNPAKQPWFSAAERVAMAERELRHLTNVRVDSFGGLLVQLADAHGAQAIVKGLRSGADFEYERAMALMNRQLSARAETVFLVGDARLVHVSSSLVREVAQLGGDLSSALSAAVGAELYQRAAERRDAAASGTDER